MFKFFSLLSTHNKVQKLTVSKIIPSTLYRLRLIYEALIHILFFYLPISKENILPLCNTPNLLFNKLSSWTVLVLNTSVSTYVRITSVKFYVLPPPYTILRIL